MKPLVRGKKIYLRDVTLSDAEYILSLRTDSKKNQFLSQTKSDISAQRDFIKRYYQSLTDYYFIICDWQSRALGTIRIYDIQGESFCWGSWILSSGVPTSAAIESALLLYEFAFYSLHYKSSHFDVRKNNLRVVDFHKRFGARLIGEDNLNYYFEYDENDYLCARQKYRRYLP